MNPNELIQRYLHGEATDAEVAELDRLLVSDRVLRRRLIVETGIDAGLCEIARERASQPSVVAPRRSVRLSWRPLAAAAALVLFIGGWVIGSSTRKAPPVSDNPEAVDDGVALLTQTLDASWTGTRQPRAGAILSSGRLQLSRGLAQLEFYSGVRLIIEGPADVELVSANRAVCHSGRIRAWVPPQV